MLSNTGRKIEQAIIGNLPSDVRYNLTIDTIGAIVFAIFNAAVLGFIPVVLRRLGGDTTILALYAAQANVGFILSTFGVLFMRGRNPLKFALFFWLTARSLMIFTFFIADAGWMLILLSVFWILEGIPGPAYAQILQTIYPPQYRGRALGLVRLCMVIMITIATPIAGILLDNIGYQVIFPIASLCAFTSSLIFSRIKYTPAEEAKQAPSLRSIFAIFGRNRRFTVYTIGFTVYGLGILMMSPLFAVVQVDRLQLSYTVIGYLTLVQSAFWSISNIIWGRLIDKFSGLWVLRACGVLAAMLGLTYAFATSVWTIIPAFVIGGILAAGVDLGFLNAGIELAEPNQVVEYSALQNTVLGIRGLIAPFITIFLLSIGIAENTIFFIGSGLLLVSAVIMTIALKQKLQTTSQ